MDHRVGPGHQPLERVTIFETSLDPFDALARMLRLAGESADAMAPFVGQID
jgi:hypothetical protein